MYNKKDKYKKMKILKSKKKKKEEENIKIRPLYKLNMKQFL